MLMEEHLKYGLHSFPTGAAKSSVYRKWHFLRG